MQYPLLHFDGQTHRWPVGSGLVFGCLQGVTPSAMVGGVLFAVLWGALLVPSTVAQTATQPTTPTAATNGSLHPPMFHSSVGTSRDVDQHPQAASAPTNKVHTQMRLEFLERLFSPDTRGSLTEQQRQQVGTIETALYGKAYAKQKLGKRLQRVEASLFGDEVDPQALSRQPVGERLTHIVAAVQQNPALIAYPVTGSETLQPHSLTALPKDATVALGYMEERLYHLRHEEEANEARIGRIETTLYGKPTPSTALATRFSRLQERFPLSAKGVKVHTTGQPTMTILPIQRANDTPFNEPTPVFSATSPPPAPEPRVAPRPVEFSAAPPALTPAPYGAPARQAEKRLPLPVVALPAMVPVPTPPKIIFTRTVPRGLGPKY